ncbi:PAS domain S-box protein [Actinoplanes oblitus]|uniref:histidine kinase n=1 Tax=Actinoplanes oblitus TaxID=3040509 RepID=A0ABY8WPZ0_9ACTN|nr:PAS domain S-box protein [Actinoplanes oblitus]WIM98384.1 PAS domain S-box protein [Actinoplanes oblitus]
MVRRVDWPERVAAVRATGLLEQPEAPGLRRLTRLAARLLAAPTALVSLVTDDRQVFASQLGLPEPWARLGQTPLTHSFCQHVVDGDEPLVVTDAREHPLLWDNRAIDEMGAVAYAGMPIRVDGQTLGAFCAIDSVPHAWSADDLAVLEDLAAAVASEIELARAAQHAEQGSALVRRILEVSQDAYVSIDADGLVTEWNPAAERLFGWARDEALGMDLSKLIVPEQHREAHRRGLDRVRDTGRSALAGQRLEVTAVDRSGRVFPVEFTLQATNVGGGRPVFHAFLHDISARRAAEEQLRRQAELIDAAPAAVIVRDPDGTIRFWNQGAEQMYGWPATAAVGRNIHRLLATVFPARLPEVERALEETGAWQGELVHRRADGRVLVALSRHVRRPAADGSGYEIIETNTDITERRRAEEARQESERRFRVQFHQSTIGQVMVRLDGTILHVNDAYARMVGRSAAELCGYGVVLLTHPDDRAGDTEALAGLFAGEGDSYERTKRLLHADGHLVDVQTGVRLVRDADGRPLHLIGVVQDITEQNRARRERDAAQLVLAERNEQLQRANQLKLDLMGMLSHDIGTPLTAIMGYGELLTDAELPGMLGGVAARIMTGAHRIDELRHNVLAMCKLDAGELTTVRQPVALSTALRDAADAADTVVPIDCPPGSTVLANPAHLRQIVVNFLTNARKYGGGATHLTVSGGDGEVAIAVHDEGAGVPESLREHLFERYTRAADSAAEGHGLGLHIVASLAEANGGRVSYRPGTPTGSVFTLHLETA